MIDSIIQNRDSGSMGSVELQPYVCNLISYLLSNATCKRRGGHYNHTFVNQLGPGEILGSTVNEGVNTGNVIQKRPHFGNDHRSVRRKNSEDSRDRHRVSTETPSEGTIR